MQPKQKHLASILSLLVVIANSGCDLVTSDRGDFSKLAGFEPSNSVEIRRVENKNYASEGIGFQANFKVSGSVQSISQFCKSMNLKLFREQNDRCMEFAGFNEATGLHVTIEPTTDVVLLSFAN